MAKRLSVVIPAYNEAQLIGACLDALARQKDDIFEVIVVDNNSTDDTAEVARRHYPGARVVRELRQGISAARTRGFNEAKGEIIGRIDADTVVSPGWARAMAEAFEQEDTVGVAGCIGFTGLTRGGRPIKLIVWLYELRMRLYKWQGTHSQLMIGCNMGIRRSAWQKIADEADVDPLYHEDLALSLIIARHGVVRYDRRPMVAVPLVRYLSVRKMRDYLRRDKLTVAKFSPAAHERSDEV